MSRHRLHAVAAIAAAAFLFTGCSAPSASDAGSTPAPTATPSPTPTIDPGPVELTKEEAGERYLAIVCASNALGAQMNEQLDEKEAQWLNGKEPNISKIKSIAAQSIAVDRLGIELFDDPYYIWPSSVAAHIRTVRDAFVAEQGTLDTIANAKNFKTIYNVTWPDSGSAPQEIRYQLGLSTDTTASCAGKDKLLDGLHAEMVARTEYLAQFLEPDED